MFPIGDDLDTDNDQNLDNIIGNTHDLTAAEKTKISPYIAKFYKHIWQCRKDLNLALAQSPKSEVDKWYDRDLMEVVYLVDLF